MKYSAKYTRNNDIISLISGCTATQSPVTYHYNNNIIKTQSALAR